VDFRKQQREHIPIHIDGTEAEKFLSVHSANNQKWSTHTYSLLKKALQPLFNVKRLKKCGLSPKTLTNFYRCTIESILLGCIIAWNGNCIASNLQRSLEGGLVSLTPHQWHTACPPGHLQHPMSQEGQKDHQGHQPLVPQPVHLLIIQKARSVQVHQSLDQEIEKQLLSQGHQTVK
jgi:hypothetical protein